MTETYLEYSGISAGTGSDFRRNCPEKLFHSLFVFQITENHTAGMSGVLFGFCDKRFNIHLEGLCLGKSGSNPLVLDQRDRHIGKKSLTVSALTAKVID